MQAAISKTNIKSFQKSFKSNLTHKLSRNALIRTSMLDVAMDWDAFRKVDHTYSHAIPNEMKKVTNQKSSGRCWGFAGLNLMRLTLCEKYSWKNLNFHKIILCSVINWKNLITSWKILSQHWMNPMTAVL